MRCLLVPLMAIMLVVVACDTPVDQGNAADDFATALPDATTSHAKMRKLAKAPTVPVVACNTNSIGTRFRVQAQPAGHAEALLDARLRPLVEDATARIDEIIQQVDLPAIEKHRRIAPILQRVGPVLERRAEVALAALDGRELGPRQAAILELLNHAKLLGSAASKYEPPYWNLEGVPLAAEPYYYEPDMNDTVTDRYWLFYHWMEIMGALHDDSDYAWVFAASGRTSFITQEAGAAGLDQTHDWQLVSADVWDSETLSWNEKLMATKYTMWQNAHWGGGNHYINEWWSWEAGYKEEDCALFTGNMMAALAALYEVTRDPRTLARLEAMLSSFWHYDRITRDDPDPLALEEPDGRITRGTKTRQLYYEDERNLLDIEFVGGELIFHHNNSEPDTYTGRERKNVSRDQYYGMLLGYRVLWETLTGIEDRTPAEQALLNSLLEHTLLVTDYLFGQSNLHPEWGLEYMLYALFEGSCANPPNLSFMIYFGHVGLEEMTGQNFEQFDALHDFGHALFAFGRALGMVEISAMLFEPAHVGLTGLNQYLTAFYLSDITMSDWLFLWPPELIDLENASQRRLWRRVIASFYRKFGHIVSLQYLAIANEVFDPIMHPIETPQRFFNSYQGDYAKIEPAHVGLEEYLLPFSFLVSKAGNRDALGAKLLERYDALLANGDINFDDTDLPYAK